MSSWDENGNVLRYVIYVYKSPFGGRTDEDLSKWNVSRVTNMAGMFAESAFNRPIGDWDVSNVLDMSYMFYKTPFDYDLSKWNVSHYD